MNNITPINANATPTAKALREFVSPMLCLLYVDSKHYDPFVSLEKRNLYCGAHKNGHNFRALAPMH